MLTKHPLSTASAPAQEASTPAQPNGTHTAQEHAHSHDCPCQPNEMVSTPFKSTRSAHPPNSASMAMWGLAWSTELFWPASGGLESGLSAVATYGSGASQLFRLPAARVSGLGFGSLCGLLLASMEKVAVVPAVRIWRCADILIVRP